MKRFWTVPLILILGIGIAVTMWMNKTTATEKAAQSQPTESWRQITLDANNTTFGDILKELERQSSMKMSRKYPDGPIPSADELLQKKITLRLDHVPFWEAVVRISKAAGVGFDVQHREGHQVEVIFDPSHSLISEYQCLGPVLIGLTSPDKLYQDNRPAFSLSLLAFEDEAKFKDWETLMPLMFRSPPVQDTKLAADFNVNDRYFYFPPSQFQGKTIDISGYLRVLLLGPSNRMKVELKDVAKIEDGDVVLEIVKVTERDKNQKSATDLTADYPFDVTGGTLKDRYLEVRYTISWNTGLDTQDSSRYNDIVKAMGRVSQDDLNFAKSIRERARRMEVTSVRPFDSDGNAVSCDSSVVNNLNIPITGKMKLNYDEKAKFLCVDSAIVPPGSAIDFTFGFKNVLVPKP